MKMRIKEAFLEKNSLYILIAISAIVFIYTLAKSYGLYPSVVDELVYVNNAHINGLKNVQVPDYLHRVIYSSTKFCHDSWLDCARLLNSIFYILGLPFIYTISKRYNSALISLALVTVSAFGTVSSYTAYFMPEPLYWFAFWVLTWYVTKIENVKNNEVIITSILIFVLYSIKPHASFLIPSISLYFLYLGHIKRIKLINNYAKVGLFISAFFVYKIVIQLLIDGEINLKILGNTYTSVGDSIYYKLYDYENLKKFFEALKLIIISHSLGLLFIFFIPIPLIIYYCVFISKKKACNEKNFITYTALVVFPLILMSIIFTAGFTLNNPPEIFRVHTRYYGFSLPLLLISGAIISKISIPKISTKIIIIAPILISIVCLLTGGLDNYSINAVDGPEIKGVIGNIKGMYVLGVIGLCICIIFVKNIRLAFILYLVVFQSIFLLISNIVVNSEMRNRMHKTPYDRAALFSREYLPNSFRSELLLIGQPEALGILSLSQIYLNNNKTRIKTVVQGGLIGKDDIPVDVNWIAYSGTYVFNFPVKEIFKGDGFNLISIKNYYPINLSENRWPGLVDSVSGLGVAESWGRWTTGKNVEIKFVDYLPNRFILSIKGSPYGSNANKNIVLRVGGETKIFKLSGGEQQIEVLFESHKKTKLIIIDIPEPAYNPSGGVGLGLGLVMINIRPIIE